MRFELGFMPRTTHFHVGEGDMSLFTKPSGDTLLIDINIRATADEPDDPMPDVAKQLRKPLTRVPDGRPTWQTAGFWAGGVGNSVQALER